MRDAGVGSVPVSKQPFWVCAGTREGDETEVDPINLGDEDGVVLDGTGRRLKSEAVPAVATRQISDDHGMLSKGSSLNRTAGRFIGKKAVLQVLFWSQSLRLFGSKAET